MKKTLILTSLIAGMLCFSACAKPQDTENLFGMPETEDSALKSPEGEATHGGEDSLTGEEIGETVFYQYGNMQKNTPPGNFMDFGEEILFIDIKNGKTALYFYNKQTGDISLFCKDATCEHDTEDCVMGNIAANLEQYNGTIYALNGDNQIMELQNGKFEIIEKGTVYNFWHANEKLYAVSRDGSLLVFADGEEKAEILMDEYVDYGNVVFDNYLYASSSKGCSRIDLSADEAKKEIVVSSGYSLVDGRYIYYMDEKNYHLYVCDMDGSNEMQLTEQPILPASLNFDEEYLYFRLYTDSKLDAADGKILYRMKKDGKSEMEKVAELPDYIFTIYTVPNYDKVFVTAQSEFAENMELHIYAVDKKSGETKLLEIPEY